MIFRIKGIYKVKKEIDVMKRNKLLLEHVIVSLKLDILNNVLLLEITSETKDN